MKLESFLIVLIFNWVLWTSVKTVPIRKVLSKHAEKDYIATKTLNNGAESSVNPQIQKHKGTLTKKDKYINKGGNKLRSRSEYNKEYYQKNKEKLVEKSRKHRIQNKEKVSETQQNSYKRFKSERCQYSNTYYQRNRQRILDNKKLYQQNNREKRREYMREYRQKKKNVEGTSLVNQQTDNFINKGKLPIVYEEEGNLLNQGEGESNNAENEQNQIEVEEPNKTLEDATIDLNKKILPFDLNENPDDQELQDY
ncbi:unnamed protein product [Meloidogyne enterolobii]|uniref:Uncharacterized protein n=1 Tax=Meloidogyne enterolobii TaxID=390850 RepID=A0ACB0YC43_MELEN